MVEVIWSLDFLLFSSYYPSGYQEFCRANEKLQLKILTLYTHEILHYVHFKYWVFFPLY